MELKSSKLSEKQAIEISTWKYEGDYEIYNLPDWDTMVEENCSLCDEVKRERYTSFVNEDDELVGFINLLDEGNHIFFGIGINPNYCDRGIGKDVIKLALGKCKGMYPNRDIKLEVRTWNKRAVNCYKSQGFEIVDTKVQETYIGSGEFYVMKYINKHRL